MLLSQYFTGGHILSLPPIPIPFLRISQVLIIYYSLNLRTRLSDSIYLFFNNKRRYFAMQVATVPRKLAVVP